MELPRSRALVRVDGPRHIMPVEPVTPPGSRAWHIVHLPAMLAALAAASLVVAALSIDLLGVGIRLVAYVPGARYVVSLAATAATVIAYCLFVRLVERRRDIEELDGHGWLREVGLGGCAGLGLSVSTFAILSLLGVLRVDGFNPPSVMLLPLVIQLCTAIVLELLLCGLFFRLTERLLGSWLTLLLVVIFVGAASSFSAGGTVPAVYAVMLEAALLFAVLYMATRRLWAAIGLHAGWKFAQIALYGVVASDNGPQGFVLSRIVGPDWLTGGRGGTNTSVPALLVTTLLVVALLIVAVQRGRIVRPVWQRGRVARA